MDIDDRVFCVLSDWSRMIAHTFSSIRTGRPRPQTSTVWVIKNLHSSRFRFSCSRSRCLRTWSSVEAVVLFGYRGQRNIIMRLFGQRCPNCRGDYEQPVFPKAEIENVLRRLFKKIININYSEQNQEDDIDHGNNREIYMCEACHHNIWVTQKEMGETGRQGWSRTGD
uniref:3CxxC-type domain-containing protein n=1 Tax=Paramormyrops kingsleyae TaxID=1676925 RepID=A0A3B3SLA8_9TELE